MEISEVLSQIGLNEKESQVYLALLELGTATVHPIATKAGIKRPTTYLILDQLRQKGLVSVVPREKKALYTAESPERLVRELHRKEELLKRFLPSLEALYNAKKEKPQVQLFEGKEGVMKVYDQIYASNEVWFFGTVAEISGIDHDSLYAFLDRIKKEKLPVRDLLITTEADLSYAERARGIPSYEIRFVPLNTKHAVTDSALFGDHVVFFSFRPKIFAVMITSKEISGTLKMLHELAWQNAVKYEQIGK